MNLSFLRKHAHRGRYEIDMTNGPLLGKIVTFAVPLALSGILQLLFNAADMVVAGQFAGSQALAAVGSTGALINLIINLFIGLSVGVNVLVARYYGSGQMKDLSETAHTAILTSLVSGVALIFIGFALSRPLLTLMGTPDDVIDHSVLYMRIYFAGMPVIMLYNFGAAVLRAVGDTRRPLYFLTLAGVVNVCLNLFFVIVLKMGVAGVATATVLSQCISAALVLRCLVKSDAAYRIDLKKLCIVKEKLIQMMKIGIPAGIQGATFSVSNVIIQSTINSFGSVAMAGATASSNLEGFLWTVVDAFTQAAQSFVSQNYGARKPERVGRVYHICIAIAAVVTIIMGGGSYLAGRQLLGLYTTDAQVIEYGLRRMLITMVPYFTIVLMNVTVGVLRGLGSSILPMVMSIGGTCGLRILWIYTLLPMNPTWEMLFLSYPISWLVTGAFQYICYLAIKKRTLGKLRY